MVAQELPLNPRADLFRWGPIQVHPFYIDHIEMMRSGAFEKVYPNYLWPESLLLFKGNDLLWLNEFPELWAVGKRTFFDLILNKKQFLKVKKSYESARKKVVVFEKKLDNTKIELLSDKELGLLSANFSEVWNSFWVHGLIPELANCGADKYLEEKLTEVVSDSTERLAVMEALTAPEELSFYQQEEIELLESKNLKKHRDNYFWIKNGYGHVIDLDVEFFAERKKELSKDLKKQINARLNQAKQKKKFVQKKYHLSKEIMEIARKIADCIVWQDERKKNIERFLHYKYLLLVECSRRRKIPKTDLLNLFSFELEQLLLGKSFDEEFKKRKKSFALVLASKKLELIYPPLADEYWEIYSEKVDGQVKEIKGVVASTGETPLISGRVRIILDPHKASDFKEGSILVAPMTSPDYIYVMRKSIAIITDTGGLTSHAAIVSRELGVPCIVGTKVATQALKDGDLVEVDANKGIIRKLKN